MKLVIEYTGNGIHPLKTIILTGMPMPTELEDLIEDLKAIAKYNQEAVENA